MVVAVLMVVAAVVIGKIKLLNCVALKQFSDVLLPLLAINKFSLVERQLMTISCYEFKLHNDFAKSLVTRGLSPLPICVLDSEQLIVQEVYFGRGSV